MKQFVKVMKALSDPNRVRIVKMLLSKEMCVCELRAALGLAQPTVSKHLKVLEEAGLVVSRKVGQWVNYLIASDGTEYGQVLLEHLRGWLNDDVEMRAMLLEARRIDRVEVCRPEQGGGQVA